ncbi:hypothetical protein [Eggerthia catenaformis]|uniref:hypothetical protein n=1 Tax=Eggerthia catenaformis TaxID=31973 RepID=UPI00248D3B28|nr:hypothetical protein [Eggerthia catenaformis]
MKKILSLLIGFFIFSVSLILGLSFSIRPIITQIISEGIIGQVTTQGVLTVIENDLPDMSNDDMVLFQKELTQSKIIYNFTDHTLYKISDSLLFNKAATKISMQQEIKEYADEVISLIEKYSAPLLLTQKEKIMTDIYTWGTILNNQIGTAIDYALQENSQLKLLILIYGILIRYLSLICIVFILLFSFILFMISKKLNILLKNEGFLLLVSGMIQALLFPFLISHYSDIYTNMYIGMTPDLNISKTQMIGLQFIICGIIFLGISFIIYFYKQRKGHQLN